MELIDLGETFSKSEFKVFSGAIKDGGVVKAINAKNFACVTTGQMNHLTETAQLHGAKGLAFIKVEEGEWKSPIVKFFSEEEKEALSKAMSIEEETLYYLELAIGQLYCEGLGKNTLRMLPVSGNHQKRPITKLPLGNRLPSLIKGQGNW